MDLSREHLKKIGKIIYAVNWILIIVFGILCVAGLVAFISGPFWDVSDITKDSFFEDGINIFFTDVLKNVVDHINPHILVMLFGFSIMIGFGLAFYCMLSLHYILRSIIDDETPFTKKTSKNLKKQSYLMLGLIFVNPVLPIPLFILMRFLTYIFEYGTYLQEKADQTNRIQEEMIMSFAEITENKSEQTGKHVRRVAEYTKIMAEEMGMDKDSANLLRLASTMHDIGKLLVPAEILEKPARLTDDEFAEIKKHPGYGGNMLKDVEGDVMHVARRVALEHHERPDGRGYPDGKEKDSISIESKIVAVADVYDALTSKRSYKQAWDEKDAFNEILKGKGSQFDERVVDAFEKAYPKINEARLSLQN